MSARIVKRWTYMGKVYESKPRLRLVPSQGDSERGCIHNLGGGLISPVIVHRLGAYVGGVI